MTNTKILSEKLKEMHNQMTLDPPGCEPRSDTISMVLLNTPAFTASAISFLTKHSFNNDLKYQSYAAEISNHSYVAYFFPKEIVYMNTMPLSLIIQPEPQAMNNILFD